MSRVPVTSRGSLAILVATLVVVQGAMVGVSTAGYAGSQEDASFTKGIFADERGDVLTFTVRLSGTGSATVRVGGESVNYAVEFTVVDGNGDGQVTVAWNTYLAAQEPAVDVFSAVDGGDSVRNAVREIGGFDVPNRRIDAGEYPLAVFVDGSETDLATAALREPDDFDRSLAALRGRQALATGAVPEHLDANSTVANGDYVVLQIKTAGVFAYVDSSSDLAQGTEGVSISIEQINDDANEDPTVIDPSLMSLITEPSTNRMFLVAPTDSGSFSPGERYRATFRIDAAGNPYADSDVRLRTTFEVVHRDASIEGAGDAAQRLDLRPADDATIRGRSTLADGTQLEVELRSEDDAFLQRRTVTVRDGTFAAEFDLSGASTGAEYQVTVREGSTALAFTNAVVREPAAVSMADQRSDGESVVVEDVSLPEGGFVAVYAADATGPGGVLGHSTYLPPGDHGTVEVRLSDTLDPGTTTVVAVVHHDTDGSGEFEYVDSAGSVDGPYRRNGRRVSDGATVTVESPETPTATRTPTPRDETEGPGGPATTSPPASGTGTPGGSAMLDREWETTPGFGLQVAVLALLGAALLAARRRS